MFSDRIKKCFGFESAIALDPSAARAWLDITKIADQDSKDLVIANLTQDHLCYGNINLSKQYFKGVLNALCVGEILYVGFDLDCKYFITIYQGVKEKFVFFWIPTQIKDSYQVYKKMTLDKNQKVVGNILRIYSSSDRRENDGTDPGVV